MTKHESHPLKIHTETADKGATTARSVKFMVGDKELVGVTKCEIHDIEPNSMLMATITVAIQLGK